MRVVQRKKLDLKLQSKPGQRFGVRLTTELYCGDESFEFERGVGFEVEEVDPNGVTTIRVTYRTLKLDITCQVASTGCCRTDVGDPRLVRFQYDSTNQSVNIDLSIAIEAAGVGESFIIKVTPKGKIVDLDGIEQMQTRIAKRVIAWDQKYFEKKGYQYPELRKEVKTHNTKSHYSEREIKNMLSDMIMVFPEQHVGIGDSWIDKVKIWGKNYDLSGTYTVESAGKGILTVSLSAKRTSREQPFSWVNNEGRKVGFRIIGSYEGRFEIEQETGWLVRSKVKTRFTGEVIDAEANDAETKPILEEEVITVEPMK